MATFNLGLLVIPVVVGGLGYMAFDTLNTENREQLPSALAGKMVPSINLTDLRSDPAPTDADLNFDGVKLVNFWASWCGPCRTEHPTLEVMADSGIQIIGINYKDDPRNALQFLDELGDPFYKIGADFTGRNAIEWGVTGVPETFVIDADGKIIMRWPGPIVGDVFETKIAPAIRQAQGAPDPSE